MNYANWIHKHLSNDALEYNGYKTSLWHGTGDKTKPLLVLVHGISGDFAGLVPLAASLASTHRLVIVELPGHGGSDALEIHSAEELQDWFETVLGQIKKKHGKVQAIVAHSFGCMAVLGSKTVEREAIVLITPVPTPSHIYKSYSKMIMRSAYFWAHIYNWRVFILLRSIILTKLRTREAMRRIRFTGWHPKPTYDQVVYQASLVDIIIEGSAYKHLKSGKVRQVICGMFDTTAEERDSLEMEEVFGSTETVFLNGGHLLPIESPARVADSIRRGVLHL